MLNNNTVTKLHELEAQHDGGLFCGTAPEQRNGISLIRGTFWIAGGRGMAGSQEQSPETPHPQRRLRLARACVEDIEYHADRHLDRATISRLATCNYVQECHNLILLGATGSGKTCLATAFGMAASPSFYTVKYVRLPELLGELAIARGEGNYRKVIKVYKQVKLLILDEWLLCPLKETETRDLLEIVEGRYKKASTIFCSQFEVGGWHPKIGEPTLADAICDRIVHDSYTIVIGGEDSMRKRKGISEA